MSTNHGHVCADCGNGDVRLYRPYGNFLRNEDTKCNAHVGNTDWMVPLLTDHDGSVWGFTSAPVDSIEAFYGLPDSDPSGPTWVMPHGWQAQS